MTTTVAVVGGGLSGGLFALKLAQARPDFEVVLIESGRRLGRGVAYGACAPQHLLNVPVSRMEVGLTPGFGAWLQARRGAETELASALEESGGSLEAAFAPRHLFGAYLQERLDATVTRPGGPGLSILRGEAVRLRSAGRLTLRLSDGRDVEADTVVLATGNMAPRSPGGPDAWFYDSPHFIADPWAPDAFADLEPDAPVLLLGTGLTTVDVALRLSASGHRGPMLALSRRGLAPRPHEAGGAWPLFLEDALPASPRALLRLFREQVAAARSRGIPWQRVFDAARPAVPIVWRGWSLAQKRQFLRHLRPRWDVHRHRMAPRIANAFEALIAGGRLRLTAGRIQGFEPPPSGAAGLVNVVYAARGGTRTSFQAARVVNCTGPRRDIGQTGIPLLADLRDQGLAMPDALGLGLETDDSALVDFTGRTSQRLFALGPLTAPMWWEIVAVPEIALQIERLAARLAKPDSGVDDGHPLAAEDFLDLGAGI